MQLRRGKERQMLVGEAKSEIPPDGFISTAGNLTLDHSWLRLPTLVLLCSTTLSEPQRYLIHHWLFWIMNGIQLSKVRRCSEAKYLSKVQS